LVLPGFHTRATYRDHWLNTFNKNWCFSHIYIPEKFGYNVWVMNRNINWNIATAYVYFTILTNLCIIDSITGWSSWRSRVDDAR
ncbi:MAG: hypothetical protein MUO64_04495, partial [Anaerolineales bacterium]|nr:hypothetical protein [Anaerolineales bacterium]